MYDVICNLIALDYMSLVTVVASAVVALYIFGGNSLIDSVDVVRNIAYWLMGASCVGNIIMALAGSMISVFPMHALIVVGLAIFVVQAHYSVKRARSRMGMHQVDHL